MKSLFAILLLVSLGMASLALAVPAGSSAQTSQASVHHHRTHHPAPKAHVVIHAHKVVHRHVVVHRAGGRAVVYHRSTVRHPMPARATRHGHVVVTRRSTKIRPAAVRHVAVVRRHTTLCQQVMVHQHWVQHCR